MSWMTLWVEEWVAVKPEKNVTSYLNNSEEPARNRKVKQKEKGKQNEKSKVVTSCNISTLGKWFPFLPTFLPAEKSLKIVAESGDPSL